MAKGTESLLNSAGERVYNGAMRPLCIISLVAATALTTACQTQDSGRAEQRERAARAAAQAQAAPDESQQNLQQAQRNVVNRDGNAGRNISGY